MQLTGIELAIWLVSTVGNLGVLATLLIRRHYRALPIFFAFTVGAIFRTVVVYLVRGRVSKADYYVIFWGLTFIIDVLLQAGVVYEIAAGLFKPAGAWAADLRWRLLRLSLLGLVLAAILTAYGSATEPTMIETVVERGNLFGAIVMAELSVGMMVISVSAGLPWRSPVARIALGFGFYSLFVTLLEAAHTVFGTSYSNEVDRALFNAQGASYIACQFYWIVALSQLPRSRVNLSSAAPEAATLWAATLARTPSSSE